MKRKEPVLMAWMANTSCWLVMWAVLSMISSGCGEANARSLAVNESTAREALTTFLTAWKEGKKSTDLAPKIVGKDSDWEAGRTLESFEVLPDERSDGANLFKKVRRTIKTPKGAELKQEVSYVVGTSPVITVFRSDQ